VSAGDFDRERHPHIRQFRKSAVSAAESGLCGKSAVKQLKQRPYIPKTE
jgi:hypothetical protein